MCGRWRGELLALPLRRVAGAEAVRMGASWTPLGGGQGGDAGQRDIEVLVDVVAEGLERRDVQHLGFIGQRAGLRARGAPANRWQMRKAARAFCPTRWGRRSARRGRRESPASRAFAARWARRKRRRTIRKPGGRTRRAPVYMIGPARQRACAGGGTNYGLRPDSFLEPGRWEGMQTAVRSDSGDPPDCSAIHGPPAAWFRTARTKRSMRESTNRGDYPPRSPMWPPLSKGDTSGGFAHPIKWL